MYTIGYIENKSYSATLENKIKMNEPIYDGMGEDKILRLKNRSRT